MTYIIIFGVLILFGVLNFFLPHMVKIIWRDYFLEWAKKSGKIFLTFDDGPDIVNTNRILDILKQYDIKVTFFVIGDKAEKYPDIIKRMISDKHTVSIHGKRHLHPWKVLPWKAMFDLIYCKRILKSLGINSKYIRPPFGKLNLFTLLYLSFYRLTFVHWGLDSHDFKLNDPYKLSEWLKKEIDNGQVILLHDGRSRVASKNNITSEGLRLFFENNNVDPSIFSALP